VTEAMANEIERQTGTPVVPITYDGAGGNPNDAIIPYLKFPRESGRQQRLDSGFRCPVSGFSKKT
jgi:rubredoxin